MNPSVTTLSLERGQLFALTTVLLLAFAASMGMAFNLDAIAASFGVTNTLAGTVTSSEMTAIAIATLAFARWGGGFAPQRVYALGVIAIVSFNAVSVFAPDVWTLLGARIPAGFALGAVTATVMATAGRSDRPEATFGVINAAVGAMGILVAFVLPRALFMHEHLPGDLDWRALDGLYIVYAFGSLTALFFVRATPNMPSVATRGSANRLETNERTGLRTGWMALLGLGLVFFGHGLLGIFVVKLGRTFALAPETIGYVLMVAGGLGIVLPILSGQLGMRVASRAPVGVMIAVIVGTAALLAASRAPLVFYVITPVFAALPTAIMPIFMGAMARLDPSGALTGAHPAFVMVGGALAPFVGGALSDWGGYGVNAAALALFCAGGLILALPALAQADAQRRPGRPVLQS